MTEADMPLAPSNVRYGGSAEIDVDGFYFRF
jgi:hypothetical protein